jgi:hypothetical protein
LVSPYRAVNTLRLGHKKTHQLMVYRAEVSVGIEIHT